MAGPWRRSGRLRRRPPRPRRASHRGTLVASVHESHAYLDGACLYFTFAGQPAAGSRPRRRYYREAWDAGLRRDPRSGATLSHHHGIGLNRARFMAEALGGGHRRAALRSRQRSTLEAS